MENMENPPFFMGKTTISMAILMEKSPFLMAMFNIWVCLKMLG